MEIEVTQADREAAASGYFAWCSGNPVIPDRMKAGNADDHSMVQAFARHRIAAEQRGKIEGARLAIEAAATVAPSKTPSGECETVGQWTRRTLREAIRAIDPAAFRGDDDATG